MIVMLTMPRLSDSMSEGAVTAWFKGEGDAVTKGEAIAELETEKSTVDLEAPASGVLARIVVAAGSGMVAVGSLLAEIEADSTALATATAAIAGNAASAAAATAEIVTAAGDATGSDPTAPTDRTAESVPIQSVPTASAFPFGTGRGRRQRTRPGARRPAIPAAARANAAAGREIPATPLARRMAAQAGLSLDALEATGTDGRVCAADVAPALARIAPALMAAADVAPALARVAPGFAASASARAPEPVAAPAPVAGAPLSRTRRVVAERMTMAKATIPHFYLAADCRVDRLLAVREALRCDGLAVSINDFVVRAAALALRRVPSANASWSDGAIVQHERVDIAVAVALDDGLVTPVVRGADALGLAAISTAVRDAATRAREGRLAPHEYDGGTFTVSNLGMFGVGEMFAIVNPPQACILGVGAAEPRALVENGTVVAGTAMTLSLSADHRVLDGATGAGFLAEVRRLLEEPARMLA